MQLIFNDRFEFKCGYEMRHVPRQAGFRWDPSDRQWYTESHAVAARLRDYGDETVKNELSRVLIVVTPWTGRIPHPEELAPLAYQLEAATFALSRNRSYLGLDPGLGKSIVSALIMNALPKACAVFICPSFLTPNIYNEFEKWDTVGRKIRIHGRDSWDGLPDIQIIPDSMLDRAVLHAKLREIRILSHQQGRELVLFVDEAHRFKNETALRTKWLLGYSPKNAPKRAGICAIADRTVCLSGTPMPNRPVELYPILSKLAPETIDFRNKFEYGRQYCAGHRNGFGWDFTGASNVPELASQVIPKFMLRMKKSILDLPPKLEEMVVVAEDLPAKIAELESSALKYFSPDSGELPEGEHISTYRQKLGAAKVAPSLPFIESILEETDESVLIFAIHKETISLLKEALAKYKPLIVDGSTKTSERVGLANEFSVSADRRVMILNIQAGGVGLNLTKASRVVMLEFSWVPGENGQASDRAHRYGQKYTVLVQYLVFRNSIDRIVLEANFRKKKITHYV